MEKKRGILTANEGEVEILLDLDLFFHNKKFICHFSEFKEHLKKYHKDLIAKYRLKSKWLGGNQTLQMVAYDKLIFDLVKNESEKFKGICDRLQEVSE